MPTRVSQGCYQRYARPQAVRPNASARQSRLLRQPKQFVPLEGGLHGHRPIVHRDVVPAEEPAGGGHEMKREGPALEIDGQDAAASNSAKTRQQLNYLFIRKVV